MRPNLSPPAHTRSDKGNLFPITSRSTTRPSCGLCNQQRRKTGGSIKRAACAVLVIILTALEIHHLAAQQPALSAKRVEDLTRLQDWVRMEQSFSPDGRRAALNRIQTLLRGPEPQSDAEFYLQVASITALADNAQLVKRGPSSRGVHCQG